MPAASYNVVIEQGATWSLILSLKKPNKLPVDLTGYTVKCQIRKPPNFDDGEAEVIAEPVGTVLDPAKDGVLTLILAKEVTAELDFTTAEYDVFVKSATGETSKLLKGKAEFQRSVTVWEDDT
jgi:hypothetical protein